MDFSFEERLSWLDKQHCHYNKTVKVIEKSKEGEAEILFNSPSNVLSAFLSEGNRLKYLNKQQVADRTICVFDNNEVELHIIELKKSVTDAKWSQTKQQFEGGLINSFGLSGILNQQVSKVVFYTAFRNDLMQDFSRTTNPILLKATIGNTQKTSSIDWKDTKVKILGREFEHIKIQLDNQGKGSYSL